MKFIFIFLSLKYLSDCFDYCVDDPAIITLFYANYGC